MDVQIRARLFGINVLMHIRLETPAELSHVLHLHRQACRIRMPTKVVKQILTTLDGFINIKTAHTTRTARHDVAIEREHHRRTEKLLCET